MSERPELPDSRSLRTGFLVGLAAAFAALLVHFTLDWPTSDARTRLYFLFAGAPLEIGGFYLVATFALAALATFLAGLRGRWAFVGALYAAIACVLAIWLHLFSALVWMHDDDVTATGTWARIAVAAIVAVGAIVLARLNRGSSPGSVHG